MWTTGTRKQNPDLKFPQDGGDVGFIGQVGQNLQLQKSSFLIFNKLVALWAQI